MLSGFPVVVVGRVFVPSHHVLRLSVVGDIWDNFEHDMSVTGNCARASRLGRGGVSVFVAVSASMVGLS